MRSTTPPINRIIRGSSSVSITASRRSKATLSRRVADLEISEDGKSPDVVRGLGKPARLVLVAGVVVESRVEIRADRGEVPERAGEDRDHHAREGRRPLSKKNGRNL